MDRQQISLIAHGDHPIAAPLNEASVRELLERALPRGDERILDLGCGEGAWLVHALHGRPGVWAEGVDIDANALAGAANALAIEGLTDRVVLHTQDAKEFESRQSFDLVLNVGATHAYGGLFPTLDAALGFLAPGGSVLVGEGFWERQPSQATLDIGFAADEYQDLATIVDLVMTAGWIPTFGHVSNLEEWDNYEWSWTGTLSRWALDHPEHPDQAEVLDAASKHRGGWLHGYRGILGFVTLLLRHESDLQRRPSPQ